ncbi:MAG TPA: cell division protein ZipA C-terminal FtsZ-binding domain-containing protein [Burkholderiaceae bacterium]|nr:cell division protein ZipA C-terminal FtsZ-binding domain-containing protein [Burkholderiaceae bacterium]
MTLTLSLAVVAGIVLAGVVAQGAWMARKASPRRAKPKLDPILPGERLEPSLNEPAIEAEAGSDEAGSESPPAAPSPVETRPVAQRRSARLDALIDAIAPLTLEAPVTGELALMHLPPSRRAGNKPFLIEGLNAETGDWEVPASGRRYSELQAGVQLANRSGALNEIEYSEFVQKVHGFAEAVGAMADFPDMIDIVARARELDAFAGPHDAQLVVRLRSNGVAWSVGYIQQCVLRHGFVLGPVPGRLVLPSQEEGGPPMLILGFDSQAALADDPNEAAVRDVTLSLDVPQTPESAEPFAAWQQAARKLAEEMDASVVDDQGRPITLAAFTGIGKELEQLYRALEERDLAAGSAAARRLFS